MELMITVIVIGILASIAIPQYTVTIQLGQNRAARDVLLSVSAGEQVYKANNGSYLIVADSRVPPDPAVDIPLWNQIYMDDPNINAPRGMRFSVFQIGPPPTNDQTFRAGAIDRGSIIPFMTMDQTGTITCTTPSRVCPW